MRSQGHAKTQVLVVDDQRAFAQSMELVVQAQSDLECVGTASTGEAALELLDGTPVDVVLLDVDLPGMDGIEVAEQIVERHPGIDVVFLTGIPDATLLARAAGAGATAFLLKDSSVDEILDAVRGHDLAGPLEIDDDLVGELVEHNGGDAPDDLLTQRELEVLGLLARGRQPKEIARSLDISLNTCRGYVKNILAKLDAHSALEAVVVAHRRGLITLD